MPDRFRMAKLAGLLLAPLTLAPCAFAGKADDTLVYASDLEVENVVPFYSNVRESLVIARHVWDTLIYRDPASGEFVPMLATSWKWVDPLTLEFVIRDGVKFHNGDGLSADDVVFTVNYVLDPASKVVVTGLDWMADADKVDEHTVRIRLKRPFPAALSYVAGPLSIMPGKYLQAVGIDAFAKKPVGSGPYRITAITSSLAVRMDRNAGYWDGSPIGKAQIGHLEFRPIRDGDTRIAELVSGGIDWIWRVPGDQADQLRGVPHVTVVSSETMRTGTLVFDSLGRSDASAPFKDRRVRQAMSYAVDRRAMVANLVRGKADVMHAFCFPSQFGCSQDVQLYPYDVAKARALMADAGYAQGFDTEIWAYSERDYVEAVIGYLRAIGIRAKLNYVQFPPMRAALMKGRIPILYLSWGSSSIFDVSAITSVFFAGSDDDQAKDPKLTVLIKNADNALDPSERLRGYKAALQLVADQAYALPMFSYSMNYAFDSDLDFRAYPDEIPRFFEARWK
jgi:peptide/nickel transport system substrate-binding protein